MTQSTSKLQEFISEFSDIRVRRRVHGEWCESDMVAAYNGIVKALAMTKAELAGHLRQLQIEGGGMVLTCAMEFHFYRKRAARIA